MAITTLEPLTLRANESDEERERRQAEEAARRAESASIADEAIAGLGDLDMPEDAPRPTSAEVMGDADGGRYRGETREPWAANPNARVSGESRVIPTRPAPITPGELEMPDMGSDQPPRRGTTARAAMDLAFDEETARRPPTADDMRREPGPVPQTPPMDAPAVVRDRPAPMPGEPPTLSSAPSAASPSRPLAAPGSPSQSLGDPAVGAPKKPPMPERGRMDEGLPSEADIGSARDGDQVRRILHALGSAFAGYAGRSAPAFRSDAEPLQQRRDAGLQRAQAAKGDAIERDDRLGREESQMGLQREQLEQRGIERQASQAMAARRLELTDRQLGSRLEASERTRAQDAELDLVDSTRSRQARTLLTARLSQMPEAQRRAAIEAIGGIEALPTITGRQARDLIAGNILAPPAPSRGRAGGPANPLLRGARPTAEDRASLEAAAAEAGMPAAAIRTMSLEDLRDAVVDNASDAREAEVAARGTELVPGSGIRAGGDLATGEDARWRTGYTSAQRSMAGLRRIGEIGQRFGRTGPISPEARAAIIPELTMMRSMVAQMGNTGVINPTEVPAINAALPNPADLEQLTFNTFNSRLEQWNRILEDGVRASAMSLGVDDEGQRRLVQGLRAGRIAPQQRAAPAAAASRTFDATINGTVRHFPTEEARQRAAAIAEERGDTFEAANAAR